MKKAVIYIRVSTEEQAKHGYSIDSQKDTCSEYAIRNGYKVAKIFIDEGLSAKDFNRPQAKSLLAYCKLKNNKVDAIIVWRLDRLSRFNRDYHGIIKPFIISNNIKLLSATEINADTIEGDYVRNVMMCNAEYELSLIKLRTITAMKKKAEQGCFPAKAPIGYINIRGTDGKGDIKIDDKNAFYVKRAFELYATGMYSYEKLGDKLFKKGFSTKLGKKYPPRKFEWMLKNVFYIGKFKWDNVIYEGKHTPIISKELFYRVQSMFKDVKKRRTHNIEFSYTGLIKCSRCGCYLTAEMKKGAHNSGSYIYYHCTGKKGGDCRKSVIKQEYLDEVFEQLMNDIHISKDLLVAIKGEAKKVYEEFEEFKEDTLENIQRKIAIIEKRIKKSYMDMLDGNLPAGMTTEEWNKLHKDWHEEKDSLIMQLNQAHESAKVIYGRMDLLLKICNNLPLMFNKATPSEKKQMILLMVRTLTYDGLNINIELKSVFEKLRILAQNVNGADDGT